MTPASRSSLRLAGTFLVGAATVLPAVAAGSNRREESPRTPDSIFADSFEAGSPCGTWTSVASSDPCDGQDNDCDSQLDEDGPEWFEDVDGDDYGDPGSVQNACDQPPGFVANDADCDDDDPDVNPDADEVCDDVDNDCSAASVDGADEAWWNQECDGPDGDLCGEGNWICQIGAQICTDDTGTNEELCDGVDNDCDLAVDEVCDCIHGTSETCGVSDVGECVLGMRTCSVGEWGPCVGNVDPIDEICGNGFDENCDGQADEDCPSACLNPTLVSAPGGRLSVALGAHSETGSCGGGGSEAYITLDVTEASDVFLSTHNELGIDTVLYVRGGSCDGSEVACNDDGDGLPTSSLSLPNLAAGTYHVFVDTKTSMSATVDVDIYVTAPGVEADRCGRPSFLPSGLSTLAGSTCGFTADYVPAVTTACPFVGSGGAEDVVLYFVLGSERTVTIDGCVVGSDYDQTIYVRDVCVSGALAAQRSCNDDGCSGPLTCDRAQRSSLTATLPAGLYYLFVDGYDDGLSSCPCGNFEFDITGF